MILQEFPNARVQDEDIARLELRQSQVLNKISADINSKLEEKANQIESQLKEQALYFTDDVKKAIETKIATLQKNLQDQKGSIERYKEFLSRVANCKYELRDYGENFK